MREDYKRCVHCKGTGLHNCEGCVENFNHTRDLSLEPRSSVPCSVCNGVGEVSPSQLAWELQTSQTLKQPSLTIHMATEEEKTKRIELRDRKWLALVTLFIGLAVMLLSLFKNSYGATFIAVGSSIITYSLGSYFGERTPTFNKISQEVQQKPSLNNSESGSSQKGSG